MNVWMIINLSGMRVHDCGKSSFSIKIFVIAGKGLQGILETGKHQRVDFPLVPPGKIPQLPGQGEGDRKYLAGTSLASWLSICCVPCDNMPLRSYPLFKDPMTKRQQRFTELFIMPGCWS